MNPPNNKQKDLVMVVGSANQDLTVVTPRVPAMGETLLGDSFTTSPGGKGANQARAAAVLTDRCCLVCQMGDDVFGHELRRYLQSTAGGCVQVMEQPHTKSSSSSTGMASILVDATTGDNSIVVVPGSNYDLTAEAVTQAVEQHSPAVVLVQLEIPMAAARAALVAGQKCGAVTILNPAPAAVVNDLLPYTDILIPNESELRTLCGVDDSSPATEEALARTLLERGVKQAVIVTLGSRGALIVPRDGPSEQVSGPPVSKVVDTIGAGDGFCGSLAAYYVASSSSSLTQAAQQACGFAGLSVGQAGATYPSRHDLPESLRLATTDEAKKKKPALTFVTGNKHKLQEVQQILGQDTLPYLITNQKVDLPELQGDPVEIAKEKCRLASVKVESYCFTEDTSLCFNALNGMPGPYIKWFLDSCGHDGLNKMLAGFDDTTAYAQTIVALQLENDETVHVFEGRTDGRIVPARGSRDFGWDPIFEPTEGNGKTYAEMTKEEKNAISHRGRAFAKMRAFLLKGV